MEKIDDSKNKIEQNSLLCGDYESQNLKPYNFQLNWKGIARLPGVY